MPPKKEALVTTQAQNPTVVLREVLMRRPRTKADIRARHAECQNLLGAGADVNQGFSGESRTELLALRTKDMALLDLIIPFLKNATHLFHEYLTDRQTPFNDEVRQRCEAIFVRGVDINYQSRLTSYMAGGAKVEEQVTTAEIFCHQKEAVHQEDACQRALSALAAKLHYVLSKNCRMKPELATEFLTYLALRLPLEEEHEALVCKLFEIGANVANATVSVKKQDLSFVYCLMRVADYSIAKNALMLIKAARNLAQSYLSLNQLDGAERLASQVQAIGEAFDVYQAECRAREEQERKREDIRQRVEEARRLMRLKEQEQNCAPKLQQTTAPHVMAQSLPLTRDMQVPQEKELRRQENLARAQQLKEAAEQRRQEAAEEARRVEQKRLEQLKEEREAQERQEAEAKRVEAQKAADAAARKLEKQRAALVKRQAVKQKREGSSAPFIPHVAAAASGSEIGMPENRPIVASSGSDVSVAAQVHRPRLGELVRRFSELIGAIKLDADPVLHENNNRELVEKLKQSPDIDFPGLLSIFSDYCERGFSLNCYGVSALICSLAQKLRFYDTAHALFQKALQSGAENHVVCGAMLEAAIHCTRQKEFPALLKQIPAKYFSSIIEYFSAEKFRDMAEHQALLTQLRQKQVTAPSVATALAVSGGPLSARVSELPQPAGSSLGARGFCL